MRYFDGCLKFRLNIPIIELSYQVTSYKCIITFQNGHFRWCWKVGRIGCTWVSIEKTKKKCLVASYQSIYLGGGQREVMVSRGDGAGTLTLMSSG